MKEEKKLSRSSLLCLAGCGVFYLFFCIRYGVVLGSDSRGYIEMISAREPVYPLLLALFRGIFGEGIYLNAVIVFQSLLAAFAAWFSVERLWKRFCRMYLFRWGMYAVHAAVALLCQYAAERGSVYSCNILTEGITMSLWIIFMTLLIEAVLDWNKRKLLILLLLLTLMVETRKQMAVGYPALGAAVFFGRMGKDKGKAYFAKLVMILGGMILSLVLALGCTRLYNLVLRGSFAQNTRDMNLVLTTSLYIADPEDEALIPEPAVQELFRRTMKILEESGSNIDNAPAGLKGLEEHYEEHFDVITVKTTGPLFVDYAVERGFVPGMEAEAEADRMSGVIVSSLLKDNLGAYLKIYVASFLNGILNTVAKRGVLPDLLGVLLVLAELILAILCLKKEKSREAGMAGIFVLLGMFANIGVAAALIFCQARYMMYNMPLFYMAGIWLLDSYIERFRKKAIEGISREEA